MKSQTTNSLQKELGLSLCDSKLIDNALTHRSYLNEADGEIESNERMEFLGDSILGLIISEELYKTYPSLAEGYLSQIRAQLVRWDTLAEAARRISLGDYLILGRGEELSGGRNRSSNLAGALEALIGAFFLDGGVVKARQLVLQLLKSDLEKVKAGDVATDSKSQLQQFSLARWKQIPRYKLVASEGPDHAKTFTVDVAVGEQKLGRGQGSNKKQAELEAARQALKTLSSTG